MPSYRHHNYGNLYIQFEVKFPKRIGSGEEGSSLSPEDVAALEKILPPRIPETPVPQDAMTDDFVLEDVDPTREGTGLPGAMGEDDDDDMHPGAERVQCASQ